jgi:hypothetical protein
VKNFRQLHKEHFKTICFRPDQCVGAIVLAGQLFLLTASILCPKASAQNDQATDYVRSSQPLLLNYQELVTLGEQESVDPVLANRLNTLLTTPFINN